MLVSEAYPDKLVLCAYVDSGVILIVDHDIRSIDFHRAEPSPLTGLETSCIGAHDECSIVGLNFKMPCCAISTICLQRLD
jgi:hypothetical protein